LPNLPAPYVSPWKEFARNLRALWADLGLRGQELWRRNREGDLSVPGFWPNNLLPWFWPAVLALVLAALVSAGVLLMPPPTEPVSPSPSPPVVIRELPAPDPIPEEEPVVIIPEPEPPPPLRIDPLLELFLDGSAPEDLLLAAQPDGVNNRLELRLAESWWDLPEARRQELAMEWQARCADLGYGELRLLARDDQLIGRSARVGSGMILFNNVAPA
jgi:hypothetical protein